MRVVFYGDLKRVVSDEKVWFVLVQMRALDFYIWSVKRGARLKVKKWQEKRDKTLLSIYRDFGRFGKAGENRGKKRNLKKNKKRLKKVLTFKTRCDIIFKSPNEACCSSESNGKRSLKTKQKRINEQTHVSQSMTKKELIKLAIKL